MTTSEVGTAVQAISPERPLRAFPALLSTEAEAQAWAREDAPDGALVVADYQASPRGRGGMEWDVPARGACFSLVFRRRLLAHETGRLHLAATAALSEDRGRIRWPDTVIDNGDTVSAVSVYATEDGLHVAWGIITILISDVRGEPGRAIIDAVGRIDTNLSTPPDALAELCTSRSEVIGRRVTAHLLPMGPAGRRITGVATGIDRNGSLEVTTETGALALRPQDVGEMELE